MSLPTLTPATTSPARAMENPKRPYARRLFWGLAIFVLLIVVSHWLVEALELRFCQPFGDSHMNIAYFFQREVRDPGVVYLGSSQMHNGIIPALVEEEAARHGCDIGKGFNLGIGHSGLEVAWIVARDMLNGPRQPKVVVVGVAPLLLAHETRELKSNLTGYGNLADAVDSWKRRSLRLGDLDDVVFRPGRTLVHYPFRELRQKPDSSYATEHLRQAQGGRWLPEHANWARLPSPKVWERNLKQLRGCGLPTLTFRDDSRHAQLLLSFQDLCTEKGMRLLLVYPPQHPEYNRRMLPPGAEEAFETWIADFCSRRRIAYHDFSKTVDPDSGDFGDAVHLNGRGAAEFSRAIAPVIADVFAELQTNRSVSAR